MTHVSFQPLLATKLSQDGMFSGASSDGARKPRELHSTSEMSEMFSEVLKDLLKGVEAAKFLPIPWLTDAAGLALEIFEGLEQAHANKKDSQALARDCGFVVYIIYSICTKSAKGGDHLPSDLINDLSPLCETLKAIKDFAKKQAGRSFFKRFLTKSKDAETIQHHREEVNWALKIFSLQSDIAMRLILAGAEEHAPPKATEDTVACSNPSQEELVIIDYGLEKLCFGQTESITVLFVFKMCDDLLGEEEEESIKPGKVQELNTGVREALRCAARRGNLSRVIRITTDRKALETFLVFSELVFFLNVAKHAINKAKPFIVRVQDHKSLWARRLFSLAITWARIRKGIPEYGCSVYIHSSKKVCKNKFARKKKESLKTNPSKKKRWREERKRSMHENPKVD
ncbi:hypothetical protein K435DRAFT_800972 [Dendrothele bispora CBS 962.96]|uniref:Uncharacterized protein n=1 Tax=Dendrothele bispora (strain CBS 962.96) TaxID=1314807 RepID=A0A4S8LR30_DENBC|nr:hypothetical protein K435DRAFT_800972 [Dendrothele bispora CBS 962.96]